jgi:DNA-directed RNA polymerase subunit RPC12/RpoP
VIPCGLLSAHARSIRAHWIHGIFCWSIDQMAVTCSSAPMKCIICGKPVQQREGGPGRRRRFCGDACRLTRRAQQAEQYHREGRYPRRHTIYAGKCAVCGKPFESLNKRQMTCSPRCGKIQGDRTRSANARARNTRPCEHCGTPFLPANPNAKQRRAGHVQRWCSPECYRASRAVPQERPLPAAA